MCGCVVWIIFNIGRVVYVTLAVDHVGRLSSKYNYHRNFVLDVRRKVQCHVVLGIL